MAVYIVRLRDLSFVQENPRDRQLNNFSEHDSHCPDSTGQCALFEVELARISDLRVIYDV